MIVTTYHMIAVLCFILWQMMGCGPSNQENESTLHRIRKAGTLVVLTRNAPTTYYIGREGQLGFEHDLVTAFAASLNVSVQFDVRSSITSILAGIAKGEGDIAAAGLTRTPQRETTFLFGPDYHSVQQQVICHRSGKRPKNVQDLPNVSLLIISNSSYEERLQELQTTLPTLHWETTRTLSTEAILARVWRREVDCTVADSIIVAINRRYYPELVVAFPLTDHQPLAWVLRPGSTDLQQALQRWFDEPAQNQLLTALRDRYYGHVNLFNYVDLKTFQRHVRHRLPHLRPVFQQAAKTYDFSWTLLASQAYQESHWNAKAKSPTGVRGIMMLTRRTARSLGLRNRLNPQQSINGGARYMARLRARLPDQVKGKNRLWFTLAAYNVGMGHLKDAMTLARRHGKNPHIWRDVKQILPLLTQHRYFKTVTFGYARGTEPVRYVQRIRNYQDLLEAQMRHTSRK